MKAHAFWKAVTVDHSDFLGRTLDVFRAADARFCVIGGLAVNAYVEPVVTLDVDVVVATGDWFRVEPILRLSAPGSDVRIQIQTDPRYATFVDRAVEQRVLGFDMPVASAPDVLQGKVWAALDPTRRASKRLKDLADSARLLEAQPGLRAGVPDEILERLR